MTYHVPVLLKESVDALNIHENGVYVDLTYGGGGHSREMLKRFAKGRLFAFDQDEDALQNVHDDPRLTFLNQNFRWLKNFLTFHQAVPVDGILADLGISSHQIDDAERGFSTRFEGMLDARMNSAQTLTAAKVVNEYPEDKLRNIFFQYGELKNSGRLASMIVKHRKDAKIETTTDLCALLEPAFPKALLNKFLARVFQALRIEVNGELEVLQEVLEVVPSVLKPGGRLVVISYHSLEDRIVKNFMRAGNFSGKVETDFYGNPQSPFRVVTRKAIQPEEDEIQRNPRARSARLRVAEKI